MIRTLTETIRTKPYVHILIPRGHYIGQVRRCGARLWDTVTKPRRSAHHALAAAVLNAIVQGNNVWIIYRKQALEAEAGRTGRYPIVDRYRDRT